MNPDIVTRDEMTVVGLSADFSDICGLWTRFMEGESAIGNRVEGANYEIHTFLTDSAECFVGVQVTETGDVPAGMSGVRVPAGEYAVFTHRLANGGYEGLNPVMDEWLTNGPYEQSANFIIEVFDERFRGGDQPDSEIDFLIPVRRRK